MTLAAYQRAWAEARSLIYSPDLSNADRQRRFDELDATLLAHDSTVTVYVGIGNSDDKLGQREWAQFVDDLRGIGIDFSIQVLGWWFSAPDQRWQNCEAAWTMAAGRLPDLRVVLGKLRQAYRQDSIALAIVDDTEFV